MNVLVYIAIIYDRSEEGSKNVYDSLPQVCSLVCSPRFARLLLLCLAFLMLLFVLSKSRNFHDPKPFSPNFKYSCDVIQFSCGTNYCHIHLVVALGHWHSFSTLALIKACPCNGLMLCFLWNLKECSISSFARQVLCLCRERGTNQSIEFQRGSSDLDCGTFSFLNEREKKKISWSSEHPVVLIFSFIEKKLWIWTVRVWRSIRERRGQFKVLHKVLGLIF